MCASGETPFKISINQFTPCIYNILKLESIFTMGLYRICVHDVSLRSCIQMAWVIIRIAEIACDVPFYGCSWINEFEHKIHSGRAKSYSSLYIVSGLFLPFNKPKVENGIHSIELLLFEINRALFSKFLHRTVELFKILWSSNLLFTQNKTISPCHNLHNIRI